MFGIINPDWFPFEREYRLRNAGHPAPQEVSSALKIPASLPQSCDTGLRRREKSQDVDWLLLNFAKKLFGNS